MSERTIGAAGAALQMRSGTRLAAFAGAALILSACSSGPTDFADLSMFNWSNQATDTRTEAEKAALERDLTATGNRVQSAGNAADQSMPNAMALAVIRQQQAEEARLLLEEAGVPAGHGACDPATNPDCPPQ